jgi:hypothetical protein
MQRHRSIGAAMALVAVLTFAESARAATMIADPADFVRAVYARLAKGGNYILPEDIYSPRLNTLWAGKDRDTHGSFRRVDSLFWINDLDGRPHSVQVKGSSVVGRPDRQIVVATFVHKKQQMIDFYFERINGEWKVDDEVSLTPGNEWTLSVILKYGWPS